jgi:hypothetical protein
MIPFLKVVHQFLRQKLQIPNASGGISKGWRRYQSVRIMLWITQMLLSLLSCIFGGTFVILFRITDTSLNNWIYFIYLTCTFGLCVRIVFYVYYLSLFIIIRILRSKYAALPPSSHGVYLDAVVHSAKNINSNSNGMHDDDDDDDGGEDYSITESQDLLNPIFKKKQNDFF